ncbi:unnamed protein product, partial [Discosporangium mesarthrocarpum]
SSDSPVGFCGRGKVISFCPFFPSCVLLIEVLPQILCPIRRYAGTAGHCLGSVLMRANINANIIHTCISCSVKFFDANGILVQPEIEKTGHSRTQEYEFLLSIR